MIYINQLHLTTVMLLTGQIKLVEKEGRQKGRCRVRRQEGRKNVHG